MLYFVIEVIEYDPKHPPLWLDVTHSGVHVTYEGLKSIEPFCTISSNTTCNLPLPLDEYCFLGHISNGVAPLISRPNGDQVSAVVTAMLTRLSLFYYVLVSGCVVFMISLLFLIMLISISYRIFYFRR